MLGIKRHWNNAIKGGQWEAQVNQKLRNYDEFLYDKIQISTSSTCHQFEVIETIFCIEAAGTDTGFSGLNVLFPRTLQNLRVQCSLMGGDAVINCEFDHRVAVGTGFLGQTKQFLELFAFGTAIKYQTIKSNNFIKEFKNENLDNEAYKIFLVKNYNIEFNKELDRYIVIDRLFNNIDDALIYASESYQTTIINQNNNIIENDVQIQNNNDVDYNEKFQVALKENKPVKAVNSLVSCNFCQTNNWYEKKECKNCGLPIILQK